MGVEANVRNAFVLPAGQPRGHCSGGIHLQRPKYLNLLFSSEFSCQVRVEWNLVECENSISCGCVNTVSVVNFEIKISD